MEIISGIFVTIKLNAADRWESTLYPWKSLNSN